MKLDILEQYISLQASLNKERAELRARLTELKAALGGESPIPLPSVEAEAPVRRKRRMSAAGRAAVAAATKARWAALRAKKTGKAAPQPVRQPKKHVSAAARAKMAAAAIARWAKAKAAGKTRL